MKRISSKIVMHYVAAAGCAAPFLLAVSQAPSPTAFNQAMAWVGWGLILLTLPPALLRAGLYRSRSALIFLAVFSVLVLVSFVPRNIPADYSLATLGSLAGMAVVLCAGSAIASTGQWLQPLQTICRGLLLAGLLSAFVAVLQVYFPNWVDGTLFANSHVVGRATGNLRQPNHLAYLLIWSVVAVAVLVDSDALRRRWAIPLLFALTFALVLSASRTGLLCLTLLVVWTLFDRTLGRKSRSVVWALPIIFITAWFLAGALAGKAGLELGAQTRFVEGVGSPSRWLILRDTLQLILIHPWGVGWGEFNFAWTLTPMPGRSHYNIDNVHNLLLQWAVELGIPAAILLSGLAVWALISAFGSPLNFKLNSSDASQKRYVFLMVALMVPPSLLEYPLWYAYFSFPTLFFLGICLGSSSSEIYSGARGRIASLFFGVTMIVSGAVVFQDYLKAAQVFNAPTSGEWAPLKERIKIGRSSWFFSWAANYAAATRLRSGDEALFAAEFAAHGLIDTLLLSAWAKSMHLSGDDERARFLAERLAEFNDSRADKLFEVCQNTTVEPRSFQCSASKKSLTFEDFRTGIESQQSQSK